jgi:hypothetical protein
VAEAAVRFLIDESSLSEPCDDLEAALDVAVSRIQAVRRGGVGKLSWIWEEVVQGHTVAEWVFDRSLGLDPVVAAALREALDRSVDWDEVLDTAHLPPDVEMGGAKKSAWSVGAAASFTQRGISMACVPLVGPLGPRTVCPLGAGSNEPIELWFVGDDTSHLAFYRALPEVEDLDEDAYFVNAARAFPRLKFFRKRTRFADFDEEYRTIRRKVTRHLAVLNDHAPEVFRGKREPRDIQAELGSRGVEASGESGNTKADAHAMRQRKITFGGGEITLDWHTKLRPHLDRIYFSATARPYVVVGVFHKHLA